MKLDDYIENKLGPRSKQKFADSIKRPVLSVHAWIRHGATVEDGKILTGKGNVVHILADDQRLQEAMSNFVNHASRPQGKQS